MTNSDHIPTVKMYKEETVCCECGRYIKNVVEIDGAQYGTRCCEKYLPRHYSLKKGVVVAEPRNMLAEAAEIMGKRFTPFYLKSSADLAAYINRRVNECPQELIVMENLRGIALILAARVNESQANTKHKRITMDNAQPEQPIYTSADHGGHNPL